MADITIIIGNQRYSSWSLRGWLAARFSGLETDVVKLALFEEADMQRLKQLSQSGLVPALVDNRATANQAGSDKVGDPIHVWDSLAIIDYLDSTTGANFWPEQHQHLAMARSLTAEMHSGYPRLRKACPMNLNTSITGLALSDTLAKEVAHLCRQFDRAFAIRTAGDYLLGPWGAVDIMYAPVASRIKSYGLPVSPPVLHWVEAVFDHPHMKTWISEAAGEDIEIPKYIETVKDNRLVYDID